jgi:hypothetical protein
MHACTLSIFWSTIRTDFLLANGLDIPFTMPLNEDSIIVVHGHLLNLKFNFCIETMNVEYELYFNSGKLREAILL